MFRIQKKKKFFQNQVYKAYTSDVIKKNLITKNFLTLEVVNKYKNYGGVSCLIINHEGKIGLMKVKSPFVKGYFYSVVQGFLNKKETPLKSIQRELKEEIGLSLKKKNIKKLCNFYPIISLINTKMNCYYAKINRDKIFKKDLIKDEFGIGKIKFYTKKKILLLMKEPDKFDMISYLLLSFYFRF